MGIFKRRCLESSWKRGISLLALCLLSFTRFQEIEAYSSTNTFVLRSLLPNTQFQSGVSRPYPSQIDNPRVPGVSLTHHNPRSSHDHSNRTTPTSQKSLARLSTFIRKHQGNVLAYSALLAAMAFCIPTIVHAVSSTSSSILPSNPWTLSSASNVLARLSETGFYQAFSLVFVSEIGDKTFFIAGLLAMKAGRLISFVGSVSALAVMTLISVIIGQLFHAVPTGITSGLPLDDIAAVIAFAFFGLKTLKEASEIQEGDTSGLDEELEEAETAVQESQTVKQITAWGKILSTFGLVFAAELGDRSFISTIALSAAQEPVGVAVGAIAAHALATGVACVGGSYVSKYISERAIGYIGGSLFIFFAVTTALGIF